MGETQELSAVVSLSSFSANDEDARSTTTDVCASAAAQRTALPAETGRYCRNFNPRSTGEGHQLGNLGLLEKGDQ